MLLSGITLGAMGDSFYEYLLKTFLLMGQNDEKYKTMYLSTMTGMFKHLYNEVSILSSPFLCVLAHPFECH